MRQLKPLEKFKILIADADKPLVSALMKALQKMGFTDIHPTTSGLDALAMMRQTAFDLMLTDWNLNKLDGLALVDNIRCDPRSLNLTLPIVMLSGRAEAADVIKGRDHGVNEYAVKPFTARTIYQRLERLVEWPRPFILSEKFIGPDRRAHATDTMRERRKPPLPATRRPWDAAPSIEIESPKSWLPDFSLKEKLGHNVALGSIITPLVLKQAQSAIDEITSDSLQWMKDDLTRLKMLFYSLNSANARLQETTETALLISSRAGTFGQKPAAKVAYMLYLFCRNKLTPDNRAHLLVVEKHIEILQLLLSGHANGSEDAAAAIISDLNALAQKYGA